MMLAEVGPGAPLQKWYPNAREGLQSLVLGSQHYIRSESGHEELFNLESDVGEEHNLASFGESLPTLEAFRACLHKLCP
jgi:hypothetical protein